MNTKLAQIGIHQPDSAVLLGGGPYDSDTQVKIIAAVECYLGETGMLGTL